jgi:hypothetical protein
MKSAEHQEFDNLFAKEISKIIASSCKIENYILQTLDNFARVLYSDFKMK